MRYELCRRDRGGQLEGRRGRLLSDVARRDLVRSDACVRTVTPAFSGATQLNHVRSMMDCARPLSAGLLRRPETIVICSRNFASGYRFGDFVVIARFRGRPVADHGPVRKPTNAIRCGAAAGVFANATPAGRIASSSGSAMQLPAPRNTVRRERCFFAMNISCLLLPLSYCAFCAIHRRCRGIRRPSPPLAVFAASTNGSLSTIRPDQRRKSIVVLAQPAARSCGRRACPNTRLYARARRSGGAASASGRTARGRLSNASRRATGPVEHRAVRQLRHVSIGACPRSGRGRARRPPRRSSRARNPTDRARHDRNCTRGRSGAPP